MRIALFAGSFNPFTIGHASIVERALGLFDRVIIAIGVNAEKASSGAAEKRLHTIERLYADQIEGGSIQVCSYSNRLTADLAFELGAKWLIRGVRSVRDFEYERDLADINRRISGIETVLLPALPELGAVSSSVVRELAAYGRDVSEFLPNPEK